MFCDTSALPVVGLCQELADLVRGDGKGDAGSHFQCVDADYLAVLEEEMPMLRLKVVMHLSICGTVSLHCKKSEEWLTRFIRGPPEFPYCEEKKKSLLSKVVMSFSVVWCHCRRASLKNNHAKLGVNWEQDA